MFNDKFESNKISKYSFLSNCFLDGKEKEYKSLFYVGKKCEILNENG